MQTPLIPHEFTGDFDDYLRAVMVAAKTIKQVRQSDPWAKIRRPSQTQPVGDWSIWMLLAGRGFGKTRTGAELVREEVMAKRARRIAFVAPTAADARDTMVEGDSGILAVCEAYKFGAKYESSKRRVTFANGARATLFSAEEPKRLRGPEHDLAWSDELAAWKYLEDTWSNLQFGLRQGYARQVITSTPRPLKLIRQLVREAMQDESIVVTSGSTYENLGNLSGAYRRLVKRYEGTRLGRQELLAEILEDVPGALWTLSMIDRFRVRYEDQTAPKMDDLRRVVIGVDPKTGDPKEDGLDEDGSETGIVVCGLGPNGHGYVLDDVSIDGSPLEWANRVVEAYDYWRADKVVAEANNGGAMVRQTLLTVRPNLPVELVYASRGKITRAEPVSSLQQQGVIHHVGAFPELEDQLTTFDGTGDSPDRLDAYVWAMTHLLVDAAPNAVDERIAAAFHGLPGMRLGAR